jgi:hypothetical protein
VNKAELLRYQNSCLNKARADEPVFVLRANDPLAAQTIRHWATMASDGVHDPEKVDRALQEADEFDRWYGANVPQTIAATTPINMAPQRQRPY